MPQPPRQPLTPASTDPRHGTLRRLKSLSTLLDNAVTIPGINYRVGLDPLLGLIAGAGDLAGVVFSTYIVLQAARWRLPKETIGRMVFNILCEALVGQCRWLATSLMWRGRPMPRTLRCSKLTLPSPGPARRAIAGLWRC